MKTTIITWYRWDELSYEVRQIAHKPSSDYNYLYYENGDEAPKFAYTAKKLEDILRTYVDINLVGHILEDLKEK